MPRLVESICSFREWERAELPQQMPSLVGSLAAELSRFESYTCPLAGDHSSNSFWDGRPGALSRLFPYNMAISLTTTTSLLV